MAFPVLHHRDPDRSIGENPEVNLGGGRRSLSPARSGQTLKTTTGEIPLVPFRQVGLERYSVYFPLR